MFVYKEDKFDNRKPGGFFLTFEDEKCFLRD